MKRLFVGLPALVRACDGELKQLWLQRILSTSRRQIRTRTSSP